MKNNFYRSAAKSRTSWSKPEQDLKCAQEKGNDPPNE